MTGWRLGYVLAPKPLVDAITKLQSQSTSNPTSITQYAGLAAMRGPMDSVATMLAEYARRRERISQACARFPASPAPRRRARSTCSRIFPRISTPKCRTTSPSPSSFWNANTSRSFPAKRSARPDICAFRTPRPWIASTKDCAAWRVSSARKRASRRHLSLSRASGADFQPTPLGRSLSCAVISRKIASRRADRRSLDDRQGVPLRLRPVRRAKTRRRLAHDALRMDWDQNQRV